MLELATIFISNGNIVVYYSINHGKRNQLFLVLGIEMTFGKTGKPKMFF